MGDVIGLLDRDVFGMGQVDRLLGLSSGTACRWIDGYSRRGRRYEPLVRMATTGAGDRHMGRVRGGASHL